VCAKLSRARLLETEWPIRATALPEIPNVCSDLARSDWPPPCNDTGGYELDSSPQNDKGDLCCVHGNKRSPDAKNDTAPRGENGWPW
jgi:hypothetical protein